ncbi:MAG: endonuclease V [Deltaproteobacteria bacterium]|nr:endonuclease V [Deltaproteobacteria bacterium]MCL4873629.1 endonuclease V [bacterium]
MDPEAIRGLRWPADRERIREIQAEIGKRRSIAPLRRRPCLVAGIDASFLDDKIISVASLLSYPALEPLEESVIVEKAGFPYITGLLSFREGPAVLGALKGLKGRPDLLIFDGQGIAHPLGLGIAAFMGALLNVPSIGSAKTRLVGEYKEPGPKRGDFSDLVYKGAVVGAVVRTRDNVKPLFVSPGHRIDVAGSVELVLECAPRFRITEPVRRAHLLSRKVKRELMDKSRA